MEISQENLYADYLLPTTAYCHEGQQRRASVPVLFNKKKRIYINCFGVGSNEVANLSLLMG